MKNLALMAGFNAIYMIVDSGLLFGPPCMSHKHSSRTIIDVRN